MIKATHRATASLLQSLRFLCHNPNPYVEHLAKLNMRAARRAFLNKAVLHKNKDIINAELRQPNDFVLSLRQKGLCPGVILPYSGQKAEEIDVVVHGKAMKKRMESFQYPLNKVYVRVAGRDHECVLEKVRFNIRKFIEKVYFRQYVPGQPNKLTVPIRPTHLEENKHFHGGADIELPTETVDILCYNHEYPTCFYVDVSVVNPDRPYRVGDLSNTFPPGIVLAPKADPNSIIFETILPEGTEVRAGQEVEMDELMASLTKSDDSSKKKPETTDKKKDEKPKK